MSMRLLTAGVALTAALLATGCGSTSFCKPRCPTAVSAAPPCCAPPPAPCPCGPGPVQTFSGASPRYNILGH